MHPNARLLTDFFEAFARRDAEGMAACYRPDVRFSDPVFPDLRGERAADMWRMLLDRATDLAVEVEGIEADDAAGRATWTATYTLSGTGRRVRNRVASRFAFADGRIAQQTDRFDLWRWTRMALGVRGWLLGWSGAVQQRVRERAARALAAFERGR